jgi:hypothetical protein
VVLYESVFRKLSIADSIADSIISKNDAGQPLRDSENNLIRVSKVKGIWYLVIDKHKFV